MPIGYARFGLNAVFDTTVEQIRRNCSTTASQMRCPYHHQNAWVEVEGDEFNTFHIDIITCCEEFEQRVRKSLMDSLRDQELVLAEFPRGATQRGTSPTLEANGGMHH